jgi:hypothetical protein
LTETSIRLLAVVFREQATDAWVCWKNNMYGKRVRDLRAGDLPRGEDCYFSIALLKPEATARTNENADRVMAVVIDDVGTKIDRGAFDMFAPAAVWEIETSPGNFQVGYAIRGGCTVEQYAELRSRMKTHPVWGKSDGVDPVHLFRLPQGMNTKHVPAWRVE